MLGLLLISIVARAAAPAPEVEAMVSTDGAYVVRLSPAQPWLAAEVTVSGAVSEDVGAQEAGGAFSVEGDLPEPGTMWITVSAALSDTHGASWVFSVEPQVVPMQSPKMTRMAVRSGKKRRCRLFGRR